LCSQMEAPPQSLHLLLRRLCSQMEAPPQSLHVLLTRLCQLSNEKARSQCNFNAELLALSAPPASPESGRVRWRRADATAPSP